MKCPLKRLLALMILLVLTCRPVNAGGDLFSIGVDANVTVGLDPASRALLQALPQDLHDKTLLLLKEALPLLKADIDGYLDRINYIVGSQVTHMQCATNGTVANVLDQLWNKSKVQPVADLRLARTRTIEALGLSAEPQAYSDSYYGLTYQGALAACKMEISLAQAKALQMEQQFLKLANMWDRLDGECSGVQGCFAILTAQTHDLLTHSDKRDVDHVAGWAQFSVVQANPPAAPKWWQGNSVNPFDPLRYEQAMEKLFLIGDKVQLARLQRLENAKDLMTTSEGQLKDASSKLDAARSDLQPQIPTDVLQRLFFLVITQSQIDSAKVETAAAQSLCDQSEANLGQAVDLDHGMKDRADKVRTSLTNIRSAIDAVNATQPHQINRTTPYHP